MPTPCPLQLLVNLRIVLLITRGEKAAGILRGIVLKVLINLGSIAIIVLSVPIQVHKTGIPFEELYFTRKLLFSAVFSNLLV